MDQLTLTPIKKLEGEVTLPGSKSLSNRALLLSALASGDTLVSNLLQSDDVARMLTALEQLGVQIEFTDETTCRVVGNGGLFATPANTEFFLGNAGTAIRPLASVLAMIPGTVTVDGDQYMRERPIEHLVDALRQLGAGIEYLSNPGYPPLRIEGGNTRGGSLSIRGDISSQYLTALLMSTPMLAEDTSITVVGEQVSKPYLDITLDTMARFGVTASHTDHQSFHIPGNQQYKSPGSFLVEGDASSASYFFAGAAIGGSIKVNGLGRDSIQGDVAFLDVIEQMGAIVNRYDQCIEVREAPHGLKAVDVDLNHIPDAAMTIASLALFATGTTTIRNIYNWRVKETDRMTAMANELRKLGATVETGEDYIVITPPAQLNRAEIDTYGDHRIAMAFSLAGFGEADIVINDPACTRKTFPDYFQTLESVSLH